jgi:signal transduction histidine kinase
MAGSWRRAWDATILSSAGDGGQLPQVTAATCRKSPGLERRRVKGHSGRMDSLRARLAHPMILAAVMVWLGIGIDLVMGTPRARGGLPSEVVYWGSLALHLAFLALVLACGGARRAPDWRRLLPDAALLALVLLLAWLRPYTAVPVLLIVVMGQLGSVLPIRRVLAAWAGANLALYAILALASDMTGPLVNVLMIASFQLFAIGAAWAMAGAERARDELAQVNAELLATRSLLAESARDQERLRLSRELHDVAGHKLTALKLNLAVAARDPALAGSGVVATSARLADELLGDIRGVVAQMRAHDGMDLRGAIEQLAAPLPHPRVHVSVDPGATVERAEQAAAIVRAVQEALTNAARHSGAANVWIRLRRDGDRLDLEVRDDGRGGTPLRFGNGLSGMRERLRAVDGDVEVSRADGGGVALHAWLRVA